MGAESEKEDKCKYIQTSQLLGIDEGLTYHWHIE